MFVNTLFVRTFASLYKGSNMEFLEMPTHFLLTWRCQKKEPMAVIWLEEFL